MLCPSTSLCPFFHPLVCSIHSALHVLECLLRAGMGLGAGTPWWADSASASQGLWCLWTRWRETQAHVATRDGAMSEKCGL